jgi:hypothetical protein
MEPSTPHLQPITPPLSSWLPWKKISFRFFFLLLGSSTLLCWDLLFLFAFSSFYSNGYNPALEYRFLVKPFHWLDQHLFHTGYNPLIHDSFPEDNHFGLVFYLFLLLLAVSGTLIWSLADRRRPNYNRLLHWFRVYLRYVLALIMFGYGIDKLIPVQMSYPGVMQMLTPLGESTRFQVLWNFMGLAPGYMMLTGASEILGSLLLINRRTIVLGCLLQLGILINVVAFNFFYNVPVKMFSVQLLIYTLFLLLPYLNKLVHLFFFGKAVALVEPGYGLRVTWKKRALIGVLIGLPLFIWAMNTREDYHRYRNAKANARREKNYEVVSFVAKADTLAPLLTDTLRWKRFLLAYKNSAIICNMKDEKDYYQYEVDSLKKTFTLHDNPDTLKWHVFHYSNPAKDQLLLTGQWKDRPVSILMRSVPIDSIRINKEKAKWVLD